LRSARKCGALKSREGGRLLRKALSGRLVLMASGRQSGLEEGYESCYGLRKMSRSFSNSANVASKIMGAFTRPLRALTAQTTAAIA
jgi:hypothetical protein